MRDSHSAHRGILGASAWERAVARFEAAVAFPESPSGSPDAHEEAVWEALIDLKSARAPNFVALVLKMRATQKYGGGIDEDDWSGTIDEISRLADVVEK